MSSDDCYDKALNLLARRPHFRRPLEAKLTSREFDAEEARATCDRLEAAGLLDDRECARGLVKGAWHRKGYGPVRMRAELAKRGVESSIIESVLGEVRGGESDRAEELARSWLRRSSKGKDALARHLAGKGYEAGTVFEVLKRLDSEFGERRT